MKPPRLVIDRVRFTPALSGGVDSGLLGWVSFVIDECLLIDGVAVRRTRRGDLALSFPTRRTRDGVEHAVVRPIGQEARDAITAAVLAAIEIPSGAWPSVSRGK